MRANRVSEILDIPQFSYFQFGNDFTGSYDTLSYKITPGEQIKAQIWHSRLCSERAEIEEEQQYPMSEEGFRDLVCWLESKVPKKSL